MKSVVNDFIIQKNKIGQSITPRYLYEILYDSTRNSWLYWSFKDINFNGISYKKKNIQHDSIREGTTGFTDKLTLTVGNADKEIQYYLDNYNGLKGCKCNITLIWEEALDIEDCYLTYEYSIESASSDVKFAVLNLGSIIDVLNIQIPRRVFSRYRCQYYRFKGAGCGYRGATEICDRMYSTCNSLGNIARFGAFPAIPEQFNEAIKK